MTILEKLLKNGSNNDDLLPPVATVDYVEDLSHNKVTIIDGMALLHAMGKPAWINKCSDMIENFVATLDMTR